jgi:DNA-directed RNA polymerase subunit delta
MDFLFEKISYLRGLADGLEVKADSKEGKLFYALLEVIEEIADGMTDIVEEQEEMNEYLDLLDEDLTTVEEELFGDIELDEDDYYDDEDDDYDFDFDEDDDDTYFEEDYDEDVCCSCGEDN